MVGWTTPSRMERTQAANSTAPAAPRRWPVMLLVALTRRPDLAWAPKVVLMARVSQISPMGVEVAWAFTYWMSSGFNPACLRAVAMQRATWTPSGLGAERW